MVKNMLISIVLIIIISATLMSIVHGNYQYNIDHNKSSHVCKRINKDIKRTSTMYYVLVEAVENYSGTPLNYTVDAAMAYADIVDSSGLVYVVEYYNEPAWSCDWWNPEYEDNGIGGYVNAFDYALFNGHGGRGFISLLLPPDCCCWHDGMQNPRADMEKIDDNVPMVYFSNYIKWVTWVACHTLYLNDTERHLVIMYAFSGNKAIDEYDLRYTYLHGLLGMYTKYLDAPFSVSTLTEYGDRLKNGESFRNAWFNAVLNNQRMCFLFWCWWQGRPAILYPKITLITDDMLIVYYDPSSEGMAPYDPNAPYMTPRDAWNSIPYGISFIAEWVYEVG